MDNFRYIGMVVVTILILAGIAKLPRYSKRNLYAMVTLGTLAYLSFSVFEQSGTFSTTVRADSVRIALTIVTTILALLVATPFVETTPLLVNAFVLMASFTLVMFTYMTTIELLKRYYARHDQIDITSTPSIPTLAPEDPPRPLVLPPFAGSKPFPLPSYEKPKPPEPGEQDEVTEILDTPSETGVDDLLGLNREPPSELEVDEGEPSETGEPLTEIGVDDGEPSTDDGEPSTDTDPTPEQRHVRFDVDEHVMQSD